MFHLLISCFEISYIVPHCSNLSKVFIWIFLRFAFRFENYELEMNSRFEMMLIRVLGARSRFELTISGGKNQFRFS